MTLENIVKRTDPELIKIFNIKHWTKGAKIKRYIQEKATGTKAEQITSEVRAEYVYHHYGLEEGKLDPYKLLSWPIDEEGKKGKKLEIPVPLRDEDKYKQCPGINGAIDIALQYQDRIDTTNKALEKLIDEVVQNPGCGDYTRLDAAIYLLSHDKLDNEKYKKTREQIIEMFREKVFIHHYGLKDRKLDPYELLSKPDAGEFILQKALRDEGQIEDQDRKDVGLWKNEKPGIKGAIDIALQYQDRIDITDEALKKLIDRVVKEEDKAGARLNAAIYLLSHDELDNDTYKKTSKQNIEMFREKVFFHHYGLEDGQLDPCKLLSWPIDEESKEGKQLNLPKALQDVGLYKEWPGIKGAIDIALQYPHRINTTDEVLDDLIRNVVQEEDNTGTRLNAAIYLLENLESHTENPREEFLKQTLIHKFTEYDEIAKVDKIPLIRLNTKKAISIPKPLRDGIRDGKQDVIQDVKITYQSGGQSKTFNISKREMSIKDRIDTIDYLRSLNYQVDCYRPEGDEHDIYLNEKYINEYAGDDAINVFVHNIGSNYQLITKIKNEKTQEAIFEQWRRMYGSDFVFTMDKSEKSRIGQEIFRKKVCHDNAECVFCDHTFFCDPISDAADKRIFQAAHVDDYHACKGLEYAMDPSNGIPLCPSHHHDFDKGLIKVWYDDQYHIEDPNNRITATTMQVRQRLEHVEPKFFNKKYRRLTC